MKAIQWAAFIVSAIGTACWGICFWWMHRLSARQDRMLAELHEVTRRIERLTREEHQMIQEVQPEVQEIKESVEHVEDDAGSRPRERSNGNARRA